MREWQESEDGQKFCSDNCIKTSWPLCHVCSLSMSQWQTNADNQKFCSESCFETTLPQCGHCHQYLKKMVFIQDEDKFCSKTCLEAGTTEWSDFSKIKFEALECDTILKESKSTLGTILTIILCPAPVSITVLAYKAGKAVYNAVKESGRQEGYEQGKEQEKAENVDKFNSLRDKLHVAQDRFEDLKMFEDHVMAIFAVALAVAHCDGEFSPEEKEEIDVFLAGSTQIGFPDSWHTAIKQLYKKPPSFNTAMKYIEKTPRNKWNAFDEIIDIIIEADGVRHDKEEAFSAAWQAHKNAA